MSSAIERGLDKVGRGRGRPWAFVGVCAGWFALLAGLGGCASVPPPQDSAGGPAPTVGVESVSAASVPPAPSPLAPPPAPAPLAGTLLALVDGAGEPAVTPDAPVWLSADAAALPPPLRRGTALWQPVRWRDLPGWGRDALHEAWNAWLRSCERPVAPWTALCAEVRQLTLADEAARHAWVMRRLQPYRVLAADGDNRPGLLTGYYEPEFDASRVRTSTHRVPLYAPPGALAAAGNRPLWTRQQIDTDPAVQAQLPVLAWLADPLDALLLQIQGSGRLRVQEPDGRVSYVRLAFAATNGHPYQSVGRWLLQRGEIRDGTWEAIRAWAAANPQRVDELLWANPRVVFFREEPLSALDAQFGPRGAQGVALTPLRSVAVDRDAIPYGTPLWLVSSGPVARLQRLVLAQDTGSAIVGAVRADFFTGWGDGAYTLAAGLKQPLQLWALWPRSQP